MKTKRFLSILLSLMLVLGMLTDVSLTASAADSTTTINGDGTADKTETMTITLTIAAASVKTAPTANILTYSGSAQTLTTTGVAEIGTMQYQLGDNATTAPTGEWTTTLPQGTDAKDYYVWYRSYLNDNNISNPECVTATIAKASITNATVSLSDTSLTYSGSEQNVSVTSVKLGDSTLTAGTDYEATSGTSGTAKNTYTVTVTGKGNYKDTATAQWSIGLAMPTIETIPTASAITYGQTLADSTLTNGVAKLGDNAVEGTFTWKNGEIKPAVSDSDTTEYDVVFTPTDADNYATVECKVKLTVNKAVPTFTDPAAKTLAYNGQPQELVTPGEASGGTMQYALGSDATTAPADNLYTTSIPTATDAGTYYVWYKVTGDDNHDDTAPACVIATINPVGGAVTDKPKANDLTYTGKPQELVTAPSTLPDGYTIQYSLDGTTWTDTIPTGTEVGTYTVHVKYIADANHTDISGDNITVVIKAADYSINSITSGSVANGVEHTLGDSSTATITVKRSVNDELTYANFVSLEIDGKAVASSNYTTAKGSLILTLKASYMNGLTEGKHSVRISFTDGSVDTTLTIKAAPVVEIPKTGDTAMPPLWMALVLLGAAGFIAGMKSRHRK